MRINHKKIPVLESLFNKFAHLNYWILLEFNLCLVGLILGIISKAIWNCIIAFLDSLNRKTSRIQRTPSTRKNWFAHIYWMNGKKFRSSCPEVFSKTCVLKNFAKFIGKHVRPATLLKKGLWYRCFPANLAKLL